MEEAAAKTTGQRIRHLRELRDWTQRQLAHRIDADSSLVSIWERDVSEPGAHYTRELARVFGVTTDFILLGVEQ